MIREQNTIIKTKTYKHMCSKDKELQKLHKLDTLSVISSKRLKLFSYT